MEMPGITISSKHQVKGKYLGTSGQTVIGASGLSDEKIREQITE
jgi:hypothetical protein